ncbi:MAG: hypothetical protein KDK59_03200 [Simkania sp.]|nr:hypothetical protein [Simkania sp.]
MNAIFLKNYSLSGALFFEGFTEHKDAFFKEKEWNCHAITHLVLSLLDIFPLFYFLEGLLSLFFTAAPKESPPIAPERVSLKKGTIFGTKNQYTEAKKEEERQSCTVQALTFLKHLLQNDFIDGPMIDQCLTEGLQAFTLLSERLHEERRTQARDYLIKQGAPIKEVEEFLRANPGSPKEWPLIQFLGRYTTFDTTPAAQLLSGHSVSSKEASQTFIDVLKQVSDTVASLPPQEKERLTFFEGIIPEKEAGTVLTCNGLTILIAKTKDQYVIYDSHSNTALHPGNSAAYVKILETPQEVGAFLASFFDYRVGGTNQVEMMTLTLLSP